MTKQTGRWIDKILAFHNGQIHLTALSRAEDNPYNTYFTLFLQFSMEKQLKLVDTQLPTLKINTVSYKLWILPKTDFAFRFHTTKWISIDFNVNLNSIISIPVQPRVNSISQRQSRTPHYMFHNIKSGSISAPKKIKFRWTHPPPVRIKIHKYKFIGGHNQCNWSYFDMTSKN